MLDHILSASPTQQLASSPTAIPNPPNPFDFPSNTKVESDSGDLVLNFEDDHRKRRRNRTTQSCWSCHAAKRKCDRKRPCTRCIQLGLTGLCVYETDDPSTRDDPSLSETQRLRARVAELESLVRELKNKPHPRWAAQVQSQVVTGVAIATDRWHERSNTAPTNTSTSSGRHGVSGLGVQISDDGPYATSYRYPENAYDSSAATSSSSASASFIPTPVNSSPPLNHSPPQYGSERRHSLSSSISSASSSPYYSNQQPLNSRSSYTNGCKCLMRNPYAFSPMALSNALRELEHMPEHQYSNSDSPPCRILTLLRELDTIANPSSTSSPARSPHSSAHHAQNGTSNPSSYTSSFPASHSQSHSNTPHAHHTHSHHHAQSHTSTHSQSHHNHSSHPHTPPPNHSHQSHGMSYPHHASMSAESFPTYADLVSVYGTAPTGTPTNGGVTAHGVPGDGKTMEMSYGLGVGLGVGV